VDPVDEYFVMKGEEPLKSGVSNIPDQFTALHVLALANSKTVHVRVPCPVSKSVVDDEGFSIAR